MLEDYFSKLELDDVDLYSEELTVQTHKGVFLFNYHGVSNQIWYSSPITGAHHFAYIDGQWRSTRTSEDLWDRIKEEFTD